MSSGGIFPSLRSCRIFLPLKFMWYCWSCGQILSLTTLSHLVQREKERKKSGIMPRSGNSLKISCASYGP